MYVKIEPSGTLEKDGMVQVRYSFFLDKEDYGYDKCLVTLVDEETKEETVQLNPFHNHFYYFEPTVKNEEVMAKGAELCKEAYAQWTEGSNVEIKNPKVEFPTQVVAARKAECADKVDELITGILQTTVDK